MRDTIILFGLLILAGCYGKAPKVSDATVDEFRNEMPGMTPWCLDQLKYGGIEAIPAATDACFEMEPARRWRGLWRYNFESSRFCPAPAQRCAHFDPGEFVWLTEHARHPRLKLGGLYVVEFVGRRTRQRGVYGHLGLAQREIIVDRFESIRQVEAQKAPPRHPS